MKLNNISLLRLVSTVSIFAFHVLIGVLSFAGGARRVFPLFFAVQIFLFISGYLYANKTITDVKNFYLKNFIKIFIPTLIYLGFYVIMALIRWNVWTGNNFTAIYRDISFSLGHLWFVPIIMLCYLLLPVMQMAMTKGHKHQKLCIFMVILVGVGEIFNVCFLGLQVSFVPFFVGGILGKTRSQDFNSPTPPQTKNSRVLAIFALIVFIISSWAYCYLSTHPFSNYLPFGLFWSNYIVSIQALSFAIAFLYAFKFLNKYGTIKVLQVSDKYSFYVYLYHHIFVVGVLSIIKACNVLWISIALALVLTLLSTLIMTFISEFCINKIMNKIKNKTKKDKPIKNKLNEKTNPTNLKNV